MLARRNIVPIVVVAICLTCFVIWRFTQGFSRSVDSGGLHRQKTPAVRSNATKRVLVTGAAGFIGFHLARELIGDKNTFVFGIDNFNDYYDIQLKKDRAFILHNLGVKVYHEDLCHTEFLEDIFAKYQFTHVTHLAAQAGVRYSLENPLAYIRANVECQVALLEVVRKYPSVKLIYASSSSVYGKHTPVPFQLTARTDQPGNMYAATKETDELLANYYCHAYNMSAVGLRFFTVYGPWGRPDMATYKFAEAMISGKEVPMFHVSDDKPLERDFTYVDDIISGITMAMDYVPAECGEKFNLGFGQPLSVPELISILEKELAIKANIKKLPLPPTEILKTWADTSVSKELLHFQPTVTLQKGAKKFVEWFKQYAEDRKANKTQPNIEQWFNRLLKDRDARDTLYENRKMLKHNEALQARLVQERKRYAEWAQTQGIHVPVICEVKFVVDKKTEAFTQTCPCKKGYKSLGRNCIPVYNELNTALVEQEYQKEARVISEMKKGLDMIYFKGMTSKGIEYMFVTNMSRNKLAETCKKDSLCIAITTDGWMKRQLASKEMWTSVKATEGIYVFDIDYCSHGGIKCPEKSKCTKVAKGDYRCMCEAPLAMNKEHKCSMPQKKTEEDKQKTGKTKDKQKATINKDSPASDKQKATINKDSPASDKQKATINKDSPASDKQKATINKDSPASDKQKATINR